MGGYETINDLGAEVRAGVLASLSDDERFLRAIGCTDAIRSSRQTHLVLTDKRLLVFKPDADSYPLRAIGLDAITDVDYKEGILSRKLRIINSNGFSDQWDLNADGADAFAEATRNHLLDSTDNRYASVSTSSRATGTNHQQSSDVEFRTEAEGVSSSSDGTSTTGVRVGVDEQDSTSSQPPVVVDLSPSELRSQLQEMDDYGFEHFVADLWEEMGWDTTVSQASVDAGIDVIAAKETPYPEKKVIQAKRYGKNTTVGGPDIQQYASLKYQVSGADSVIIATTGSFTNAAEERASELNVKTVDGERLVAMIDSLDARDLAAEYLDLPLEPHSTSETALHEGSPENAHPGSQNNQAENESRPNSVHTQDRSKTDAESVADDIAIAIRNLTARTTGNETPSGQKYNLSTDAESVSRTASAVGNWHYGIVGVSGLLVLALAASVSDLASLSIIALPVVTYLDIRDVRTATEDWQPRAWLYVVGAFLLFFLTVPVYLYRRNQTVGL